MVTKVKNSMDKIQSRRKKIICLLKKNGEMSIDELSDNMGVSSMTIRRDCHILAKMGLIKRHLGKINLVDSDNAGHGTAIDAIKNSIGIASAKLINNGELVFINSSSTALAAIPPLLDKKVFVVTNNGNATKYVKDSTLGSLIMCGGKIDARNIMQGDIANNSFSSMRSDWSIIGCAGINIEHGISSPFLTEATINRSIVKNSKKLIVVADYRKIDQVSNFTIGDVSDVDILITDTFAPAKTLMSLEKMGIRIIQIDTPQNSSKTC